MTDDLDDIIDEMNIEIEERDPHEPSRATKDKAYINPMSFSVLMRGEDIDGLHVQQLEAHEKAYELLLDARLIDCKAQYVAAFVQMWKTPVPISDACAILQVCRQYLRKLEVKGRINIYRTSDRKCYIAPDDVLKLLEARAL